MSHPSVADLDLEAAQAVDLELNEALLPLTARSLRPAGGRLAHPYVVPGWYDEAWDWDSYFIGEALADLPHALPHLRGTVENFYAAADDAGRMPRWIHPERSFWDSAYLDTSFSQDLAKPFFAQLALVYATRTGDAEWYRPYLDTEKAFLDLWRRQRMGPNGLHVWANGLESGGDNHPDVFCWPDMSVEAVDLAVFLIREHLAAGRLAEMLGDHSRHQYFVSTARFLLHQLESLLFDPQAGRFANRWRPTGQWITVETQTQFYPLWLGPFLTLETARRQAILRGKLLDPAQFWGPHGVRSVSRRDPIYNNAHGTAPSNWQGPVWIVANHIHQMSLLASGLREEALELAIRIQRLLLADIRRRCGMAECYHAESGAPLAAEGFAGWNLLARHLLQDALHTNARSIIAPFAADAAEKGESAGEID